MENTKEVIMVNGIDVTVERGHSPNMHIPMTLLTIGLGDSIKDARDFDIAWKDLEEFAGKVIVEAYKRYHKIDQ